MNDDYTTNIHSCSDSDNKRNGDGNGNGNQYQISQVWGTWEELLLTCAVKRHGSKDWDSVAKEVGSRSSLDASGTSCRLKYQDLKRRFQDSVDDDGRGNNEAVAEDEEDTDGEIPWLEQLRSLRVAELRRDVQRCDESILYGETKDYKRVIRQHLDIKTIEKKMEKGSYVSSSLSFYRDLKLLFTNAIVFFPTSYSEYVAAQELRTLVSNEMKKTTGISSHRVIKSEGGSLVSKQKTSAPPLVGCKKKSFASKKALPSSSSFKQKDEIQVSEEKDVTTTAIATRSSRRTSKGMEVVAKDTKMGRDKNSNKKQTDSKADSSNDDDEKEETPKTEKKMASEKKKKKSVAEFLKRIKNNSPHKGKETTSKDQKKSDGNVKKDNSKAKPRELRSDGTGKKKVEVESTENKRSSKRKQLKKEAVEETATATRKRGRESGKDNQQPKKRNKR
ncbi:hypothetical protein F2Q70_00026494 [Brassica cretica]|uniref:Bromo domain-containing protein n=1 Tax=Brassica cretica TaxID=69181 RepID=A0A8S9L3J0_BRACR|nr:hypothetical protein F2Q68_00026062 [Brassica cretica]KAF2601854.1 hypothetical protein F2Q70_00026494 [Brassica cretica]